MKPLFSVIIPLYNKENFIIDTLQSVLNQTFTDFEIIIVNDGSTDNSLEISEQYLKKFDRKIIFSQKNKGLSATRNKAISLSKGEIIALLDADDLWESNFLETISGLCKSYPDAKMYGTHYYEKRINKLNLPSSPINKKKDQLISDFFKVNLKQPIICQSSFAFRKEISEEFKYDETITYAEDIDFYIRCFQKHNLVYCNNPLAKIRIGNIGQMTTTGIQKQSIINLDQYEKNAMENKSLKKYIDFYRYSFGSQYKQLGLISHFNKITQPIHKENLTWKQYFLIQSPKWLFNSILKFKQLIVKTGIKLTSY